MFAGCRMPMFLLVGDETRECRRREFVSGKIVRVCIACSRRQGRSSAPKYSGLLTICVVPETEYRMTQLSDPF